MSRLKALELKNQIQTFAFLSLCHLLGNFYCNKHSVLDCILSLGYLKDFWKGLQFPGSLIYSTMSSLTPLKGCIEKHQIRF